MGKYVVFTDFHAHQFQEFSTPDEEFGNSRFKEQIRVLEEVFNIARKEHARVLFAGDLFHKRNSVDTRVINKVFEVFVKNRDLEVYMIAGNHDKIDNKLTSNSSIEPIQALSNKFTVVIKEPETLDLGDIELTLLPYGDEVDELKAYLNTVQEVDKPQFLMAHLGVEGSLSGKSSHRLEGAFSYADLRPDLFDAILLGHYHKPQRLGDYNNPNHLYIGSTMQYSFNEEGQPTGVRLFTVEGDNVSNEFIEIPTKTFKTINADNIPEDIDTILENNYVRYNGSRESVQALERLSETENLDLSNVRLTVEETYDTETRIDIDSSTDPISITKAYMEEYYPDSTEKAVECIREVLYET